MLAALRGVAGDPDVVELDQGQRAEVGERVADHRDLSGAEVDIDLVRGGRGDVVDDRDRPGRQVDLDAVLVRLGRSVGRLDELLELERGRHGDHHPSGHRRGDLGMQRGAGVADADDQLAGPGAADRQGDAGAGERRARVDPEGAFPGPPDW
ncbi:MAG: hypothetical protein E6J91_47915 [Deltaproteobacteria bacterium]|nr:MAG: hypothetical protein E6J91_47915 [Deltaproteobacteria bacterium]